MQRCLPDAGSSEADVMCGDVLVPRMGQSREHYVISGEMDTNKIQGQGNTQTGKCDFQYFEINWYQNRHGYYDHEKFHLVPRLLVRA